MDIAPGGRSEDRVAIVTGGSRGVGRETIHRLASRGYAVVVNYAHDRRAADSTVDGVLAIVNLSSSVGTSPASPLRT